MSRRKNITLVSKKTVVKIANAFEVKPGHKYIVQIPDIDEADGAALQDELKKFGITDAIIVVSGHMQIMDILVDEYDGSEAAK